MGKARREWHDPAGMVYRRARWYNPALGRVTQVDPFPGVPSIPATQHAYAYGLNNPLRYVDPTGQWPGVPEIIDKVKKLAYWTVKVPTCTIAEALHIGYLAVDRMYGRNPIVTAGASFTVDNVARPVAVRVTKMNPGSMTWQDLGAIWLFELGDQWDAAAIEFGPDAVTTLDLQRQEGVLEEKQKALDAIACGDINKPISDEWPYGWKELAAGVRQGNWGTSFLGSYTTSIDIVANDDGSYTLNYHVTNRSRWTSATRLRWNRQGIIPDQARGEGWHLGGEVRQEWYWSEKVTP